MHETQLSLRVHLTEFREGMFNEQLNHIEEVQFLHSCDIISEEVYIDYNLFYLRRVTSRICPS